jgi:ATP-dependent DNA ligase
MLAKWYYPQAAVGGDLKAAEPYWDDSHYVAQEKLDGARYILHKDEQGRVKIYSRQISKVTSEPVIKTEQLRHLADEFDKLVPNGTVLDGEVVAPGLSSSNLVTRVTGSKPDRALEVQQEHGFLEYRAFDCLAFSGTLLTDLPYEKRKQFLSNDWKRNRYIKPLNAYGGHYKRSLYTSVVEEGGEGIILKDLRAHYFQGERHKSWVKVKRQKTFDVVFMGVELASEVSVKKGATTATKTRIAGQVGAIKYGQVIIKAAYQNGLFEVPESRELTTLGTVSGFDDATRADLTENWKDYVGRVFECTGQEQFKSGAIRHPRWVQWRDDKNAEDCIYRPDAG